MGFGSPVVPDEYTAQLSSYFKPEVTGVEQGIGTGKSQFYNPMEVDTPAAHSELPVAWTAFPGVAANIFGADTQGALKAVDEPVRCGDARGNVVFRPQDEYCEWRVERATNGKIQRITFTCEGPDYWRVLAKTDKQALLGLYSQFVSPNVRLADRLVNGKYNVFNRWNTTDGIMHLTHPANTLGAQVNIAARATVLRKRNNGQLITDSTELICCGQYGEPLRASDPSIGHSINVLAQQGMMITLKNPVGLWFANT